MSATVLNLRCSNHWRASISNKHDPTVDAITTGGPVCQKKGTPDAMNTGGSACGTNRTPDAMITGEPAYQTTRIPAAMTTGEPAYGTNRTPDAVTTGGPTCHAQSNTCHSEVGFNNSVKCVT